MDLTDRDANPSAPAITLHFGPADIVVVDGQPLFNIGAGDVARDLLVAGYRRDFL